MRELSRNVREWLGRPAREQVPALLAAAVGLLVVGAIVAVAAGGSDEPPREEVAPAPPPVLGRELPPPRHGPESEATLDAANQTALAFLEEYLAFIYGQGSLPDTGLTLELQERLRRDYESRRARVPPAQLELEPEVISLDLSGESAAGALKGRALVDDGSGTRYPIRMTLRPVDGVWRVTDLTD